MLYCIHTVICIVFNFISKRWHYVYPFIIPHIYSQTTDPQITLKWKYQIVLFVSSLSPVKMLSRNNRIYITYRPRFTINGFIIIFCSYCVSFIFVSCLLMYFDDDELSRWWWTGQFGLHNYTDRMSHLMCHTTNKLVASHSLCAEYHLLIKRLVLDLTMNTFLLDSVIGGYGVDNSNACFHTINKIIMKVVLNKGYSYRTW